MAVAEIEALTGYQFDGDEANKLTTIQDLQRVELEKDDTKLNLYFNPVLHLSRHTKVLNIFSWDRHPYVYRYLAI